MFSLEGKIVVVTGGARGIGKAVAMQMALAGANIAIIDKRDAKEVAAHIATEASVKSQAYLCNVTDAAMVESTINQISKDFGGLDILFNNAGEVLHKPALEVKPDEWLNIINVNLNGAFYVAVAFARRLVTLGRAGSIINTASMSGTVVNVPQEQASYNASKAALVQMTKSLAVEWVQYNIRVNAISPGYIATDLTVNVNPGWIKQWESMTPQGRLGKPDELAGLVIYLASDASTFTTGGNFIVDGGFTCI